MIDILARKLATQASTNAASAVRAAVTSTSVPTQAGAVGNGSSAAADQAGIAACFSSIIASRSAAPTGTLDLFQFQNGMEIEPGIYDAGDFTFGDGKIWIKARVPGTVVIRIPAGKYFMTATGGLYSLYLDGINFLGGKGALKCTNTANVSHQQMHITNCVFGNYTECAISNNYGDSPFMKIDNCTFFGASGANAAIAWGGYVDQLMIQNNVIWGNKYGIAIGPRLSGSYHIQDNDLLLQTGADIWIKPNITDSGSTNAGWAGTIRQNKFGNEGQSVGSPYPRILIANEDTASGPDRATRTPLTTGTYDFGTLVLPTIEQNRFAHVYLWNAPVIRSYVSNLMYGYWSDNKFDGGQPTYVIEWPGGRNNIDYSNTNSHFEFRESDGTSPPLQFSSHPFGRLYDYASFWPGAVGAVTTYPVSDNPGLGVITNGLSPASRPSYGTGTAVKYADPYGGFDYELLTGTSTGTLYGRSLAMATSAMGAGGNLFIEMALQKAATRSVSRIQVDIINTATSTFALRRTIALPSTLARFLLPVYLPPHAIPGSWRLRIYAIAGDVVAGATDSYVLGDIIVNSGNGRMGRAKLLSQMAQFPRNASMVGGAQGALPTGWSTSVNGLAGLTTTVNSVGADANGNYVEVALSGTTTAAGDWVISPEVARAINISSTQVWAYYWPVTLISGSLSNASTAAATDGTTGAISMSIPQYSSSDSLLSQPSTGFTPNSTYTTYGNGAWSTWSATATYIRPNAAITFPSGVVVNAVLRFYQPIIRRMA